VLWLGNSQLHAINQAEPSAQPGSAKLYRRLARSGIGLLTASQPNANLQEHYLLFEYLRRRMDVDVLLLPLVFDDLRETGIRSGLADALRDAPVREALEETSVGRGILEMNNDMAKPDAGAEDLDGVRNTFQEASEGILNRWLERNSSVWAARPELRGRIFNGLYQLRNRAFGISAQTKRKVIQGRYAINMEALEAILDAAERAGIPVVLYIVPLRGDVERPYDEGEYSSFKREASKRAEAKGIALVNLEELVPGKYWGQMADIQGSGSGYDFMHFQEQGHELLAEELEREVLRVRGVKKGDVGP
jgi:hypothetical protein